MVDLVTTADGSAESGSQNLRGSLQARLPAHMIPARIIALERLPTLPNGKEDRRALPPLAASDLSALAARIEAVDLAQPGALTPAAGFDGPRQVGEI